MEEFNVQPLFFTFFLHVYIDLLKYINFKDGLQEMDRWLAKRYCLKAQSSYSR